MKNLKLYIPFLLASFLLTGCYTQLAMRDHDYQKDEEEVTTREDQYYDSYRIQANTTLMKKLITMKSIMKMKQLK